MQETISSTHSSAPDQNRFSVQAPSATAPPTQGADNDIDRFSVEPAQASCAGLASLPPGVLYKVCFNLPVPQITALNGTCRALRGAMQFEPFQRAYHSTLKREEAEAECHALRCLAALEHEEERLGTAIEDHQLCLRILTNDEMAQHTYVEAHHYRPGSYASVSAAQDAAWQGTLDGLIANFTAQRRHYDGIREHHSRLQEVKALTAREQSSLEVAERKAAVAAFERCFPKVAPPAPDAVEVPEPARAAALESLPSQPLPQKPQRRMKALLSCFRGTKAHGESSA